MSNAMTYKGYSARIEYDNDDGLFTGRIAGIRDGVGFHGDSVTSLRGAFHEAVDDYLETCAKIGKEPQKAYSGRVMFRVSPETHRNAALAAELSGKTLNQWAAEVLDRAARLRLVDGLAELDADVPDSARQLESEIVRGATEE
ncbi:MAG: type II toxin-antitoxin system HicB family antitoxin [Spirochaetaceae bacterium]|nr:type II toxin-antitoxin system HicB family antitoxin [Spirochaetaceae bacterium]